MVINDPARAHPQDRGLIQINVSIYFDMYWNRVFQINLLNQPFTTTITEGVDLF